MIGQFQGAYRFLSNFYPAPVMFEGKMYPSSEHAYQAVKTVNEKMRESIRKAPTADQAKRMGRIVELRPNWDNMKIEVMRTILLDKFTRHDDLKIQLLETGTEVLVEGNTWNDTFWGVCQGRGKNHLGKLLMAIRRDLSKVSEAT